ncbi:conserved protein of unknown function (AIG1 domain) [endosymbiont DhMRE of Dentiscutata heterogama]|uniref:GTPase n=1 Tax=endosymbiont DhMRE of Dentiscutata heterogama TaxID=1609546 RepID=UPI0006328A73|nr:GTPase [endosymbiont DhMRE of Dentiscutata heterogama]CFW92697.1 conserved protein of unknown function (AIG1 domain) [endosymbiont DhMRE of Dentiscutata heterogama]
MTNTRNILLIGRTGSGKSTLANVLLNSHGNFEEIFKESAGSIGKTRDIQIAEFEENRINYRIVDTAGFGTAGFVAEEFLCQLDGNIINHLNKEGFQILFVVGERFSEEEIKTFNLLNSVIFDNDVVNCITIVKTKFPDFEKKQAYEEDCRSIRNDLLNILEDSKIIHIDNPPMTSHYVEIAHLGRNKLKIRVKRGKFIQKREE